MATDTLIYSFKLSVMIDINVLNLYELTKENLLAGKPQIRQEKDSGKFSVVLYAKYCGRFPDAYSSGLSDVTHLNLAKIQAQVAIDPIRRNHALVLVKLIGEERNAPSVMRTLSSSFFIPSQRVFGQSLTNTAAGSKRPLQPSSGNVLSQSQAACCAQAKQFKLHHPFLTSTVNMVNIDRTLPAPSCSHLLTSKASASENITPFSMGTPSLTTSQTPLNTPVSNADDALKRIDSLLSSYGISSIEKDRASLQTPSTHVDGISSKYFASCLSSAQNTLANSQENEMNACNRQNQSYILTPQTINLDSIYTTNPSTIAAISSSCYSIVSAASNGAFSTNGTVSSPLGLNTNTKSELNTVNFTQSKTQFENFRIKQEKEDNSFNVSNNMSQTRETNLEISIKNSSLTSTSQYPLGSSTIGISRHLEHLSQASSCGDCIGGISNTSCTRTSLTIEGEVTNINDLPSHILEKLDIFTNDALEIGRKKNKDILEKGACGFLLGRQEIPVTDTSVTPNIPTDSLEQPSSSCSNPPDDADSDESCDDDRRVNFSEGFFSRRHRRRRLRDPTAHIGADESELYEDPADVAERKNWGLMTDVDDSADIMFSNTPPPKITKNRLDELFDQMSEFPKEEVAEPCQAIRQSLLLHQKMALHWMIARENSTELPPFWECVRTGYDYFNLATRRRIYDKPETVNGGILADDMGLGKTLTTISLILTNHIDGKAMFEQGSKKKLPTTASEIECDVDDTTSAPSSISIRSKKQGYLKPKTTTKSEFNKPGYQFRQMYLQQINKSKKKKKKSKEVNDMFSSDSDDDGKSRRNVNKQVDHIVHETTNSLMRTPGLFGQPAADRKATLIVCPMSVLSNWTEQFQQHVNPNVDLKIYVFYGPERVRDDNFLRQHDIIITTYGTLTNDFKAIQRKGKPSPLHKINWLRVVLDEGHVIRNARAQQTSAMMALNSARRWLLTGTPIQNRMTDLWSMIKFLRLDPFTNRKWWFQYVVDSMKRTPKPGEVIYNRVQKIIKHIAIRRLKTDMINNQPIVKLPKRRVVVQKIKFSEDEKKLYDAMHKDGKIVICKYYRMNAVLKNYANVLAIIMRLRQLCCHPSLCIKAVQKLQKAMDVMEQLREQLQGGDPSENVNEGEENLADGDITNEERENLIQQLMQLLASGDSEECSICLENLREPVITRCAHVFCSTCIYEVIDNMDLAASCPLCRADIDKNSMVKVPQSNLLEDEGDKIQEKVAETADEEEEWHSSAKVDAVMEGLRLQREKDPSLKSLVVSQFTSFLDVLQKPLCEEGFDFVRLDGTMSQAARTRVIDEFNQHGDMHPTVMLLSLTAGGVGLNLVAASRVFLLDPAWNPAVEEQCFDRCHRLGQNNDVIIIKESGWFLFPGGSLDYWIHGFPVKPFRENVNVTSYYPEDTMFIVEDTVEDRMLILQKQKRELMQRAFGMAVKSPEERRAAALRDIGTLLGINFGGNVNPRNPPRNPPANPRNGFIDLDGEDDVEELPAAPLNDNRRSYVL